jgi:hypothetical protein
MTDVKWDKAALEHKLLETFMEFFCGDPDFSKAPAHVMRAHFEQAGRLLGRTMAVVNHDGAVNAELAMKIRHCEEWYRKRCAQTVRNVYGPGGKISGQQGK